MEYKIGNVRGNHNSTSKKKKTSERLGLNGRDAINGESSDAGHLQMHLMECEISATLRNLTEPAAKEGKTKVTFQHVDASPDEANCLMKVTFHTA